MQCIRPIKVSQTFDGTLTYKQKNAIPGMVPWEFSCRKCLPCRLKLAREKAIRAIHEAQMHEENIFLTLTYAEEHLSSPRLVIEDFQTFMKDLRDRVGYSPESRIGVMYTGEYGGLNKRPHWHAILFNYRPPDAKPDRKNERGDQLYVSEEIDKIWKKGKADFGAVTMDSAGYVARYQAKKLVHGKDQDHDFHPIHKTSSKNAIGKRWIEKHWPHTFNHGFVVLPDGNTAGIPRYYSDWLKKHQPSAYRRYVTEVLPKVMQHAEEAKRRDEMDYWAQVWSQRHGDPLPITRSKVKHTILKQKFKQLQEHLKL